MSTYVEVPAEAIESFLQERGFKPTIQRNEIVYVRRHHRNPNVMVKVYTSISTDASVARGCGADSIKVCAVFDDGKRSFGIAKLRRVHRTGSVEKVLERMLGRMRDAYAQANQWVAKH